MRKLTSTKPLSIEITTRRWKMLDHALRLGNDTNVFKFMKFCFEKQSI